MKKTLRTIAMILVLILFINTFTGCFTAMAIKGEFDSDPLDLYRGGAAEDLAGGFLYFIVLPVDVPIALIALIIRAGIEAARNKRGRQLDDIDTFSAESLPRAEIASLTQRINSLPEAAITPFAETINSFTETEISAIDGAFSNLSEAEIIDFIEALNSMPDERLIAMLNDIRHIGGGNENK